MFIIVTGTRAEVKNINSIRGLVNAIEYEVDRQIEILENGGIIENETRNYDGNTKKTVSMRDKSEKGLQIYARTKFASFKT